MERKLAKRGDLVVARPLPVLVRLIKADLYEGDEAAKEASMPYYIAAGEKLLEVKKGGEVKGNFTSWATKAFQRSESRIRVWMRLAKSKKAIGDNRFKIPRTLESFEAPNRIRTTVDINKKIVDDIKRAHPEILPRVQQRRQEQERLELDVALEYGHDKIHNDLWDIVEQVRRTARLRCDRTGSSKRNPV